MIAVRIALVMHQPLGDAFRACIQHILGKPPELAVFDIHADAVPAVEADRIYAWIATIEPELPVLLFSDLFGSTPCNIARQVCCKAQREDRVVQLLTGANVGMVLKALTDECTDYKYFVEHVREAGIRGIVQTRLHNNT